MIEAPGLSHSKVDTSDQSHVILVAHAIHIVKRLSHLIMKEVFILIINHQEKIDHMSHYHTDHIDHTSNIKYIELAI